MKHYYIKDFVNVRYWVDLDFDTLIPNEYFSESSASNIPRVIVVVVAAIALLVCIVKLWWLAFVFWLLLILFVLLLGWLQKKMDVAFPKKFTIMTILTILMASVVSMGVNEHIDDVKRTEAAALAEQQRQAEIEKQLEQERIAREKEQERINNLTYYTDLAKGHLEKKNVVDAVQSYKMAMQFADAVGVSAISYKIANLLFANKKYGDALEYYKKAQYNPSRLDSLHYNKAVCYVNAGEIAAAAYVLKQSVRTPRVEALFNKINPIKTRVSYVDKPVQKKRVAYYTILCRDGSTSSSSSRRGTCSHHGGVSDWEHPVYETYTENQKKKVIEKYREYGEL